MTCRMRSPCCDSRGNSGTNRRNLLRKRNGCFAFESALPIFPFGRARGVLDIETSNAGSTWRSEYGELFETGLVLAEDLFEFPWCIEGGMITLRDAETGRATAFAATLEEWAAKMLLEWRELTGQPLPTPGKSVAEHSRLASGSRRRSRSCQKARLSSAISTPPIQSSLMRFRGSIASQIRDLPDGKKV